MKAQELFKKDGTATGVFYCSKCGVVSKERDIAEECCQPYKCKDCGCETRRYWNQCNDCSKRKTQQNEIQMLEVAELVEDDKFYLEGYGDDGFVFCLDSFHNELVEQGEEAIENLPDYAFALYPNFGCDLDAEEIVASQWEDKMHEYYEVSRCKGLDDLQAALDKFRELNNDPLSFEVDHRKKVDIRDLKKEALKELEE